MLQQNNQRVSGSQQEGWLLAALESTTDFVIVVDRGWTVQYASLRTIEQVGQGRELLGLNLWDAFPEARGSSFQIEYERSMRTGLPGTCTEYFEPHRRWYNVNSYPFQSGLAIFFRDVSKHVQAQQQQASSEERFRRLFEDNPQPMWIYDRDTHRFLAVNDSAVSHYGYTRDEFLAMTLLDIQPQSELQRFYSEDAPDVHYRSSARHWLHKRKDGSVIAVEITALPTDFYGVPAKFMQAVDITDRLRTGEALEVAEERYRSLVEAIAQIVWTTAGDGSISPPQPGWTAFTGQSNEEMTGDGWLNAIHPEDRERTASDWADAVRTGRVYAIEHRVRRCDGEYRTMQCRGVSMRNEDGSIREWIGVHWDVTEQRRVERELRESEDRFRCVFTAAPLGMVLADIETARVVEVNAAAARMFGWSVDEMPGRSHAELSHPDDIDYDRELTDRLAAGQISEYSREKRYVRRDGTFFWCHLTVSRIQDSTGRTLGALAILEDITDRKSLEEQLRQAQKMDAVGRLAGGIAHDFNNLLTVILGQSVWLLDFPPATEAGWRSGLEEIRLAAERASSLTSQLLAFSRKQVRQVASLNVNGVVSGMEPMIRRLLGEDVRLIVKCDPSPALVRADKGQLEQVMLNLAVNARDAMPGGGTLAIEVRNIQLEARYASLHGLAGGSYVLIDVSDTGVGMDDAVKPRLFEPFFTTKDPGKGTGLGLSTVYAIVQQSGGAIAVDSHPGQGALFSIYLPSEREAQVASEPDIDRGWEKGSAAVLLVEDESRVRRLVTDVLRHAGYSVISCENAQDALDLIAKYQPSIDLVVTDVVMPGMSGPELVSRLIELRPDLRVLYISGYTTHPSLQNNAEEFFLHKPFTPAALLRKVAERLRP